MQSFHVLVVSIAMIVQAPGCGEVSNGQLHNVREGATLSQNDEGYMRSKPVFRAGMKQGIINSRCAEKQGGLISKRVMHDFAKENPKLEMLKLEYVRFADDAFEALADFENLESILMWEGNLNDSQLRCLGSVDKLRSLYLTGVLLENGICAMSPLLAMQDLILEGCTITEEQLLTLSAMPELRRLDLSKTGITGWGHRSRFCRCKRK
jgi:hypothetical protein